MKLVGDFLSRFQSLTPPNDSIKEMIVEVVRHTTATNISKKSVRVQNGTAFISGSSIFKNVLRTKRGEILDLLYEKHPKARDSVRDIR